MSNPLALLDVPWVAARAVAKRLLRGEAPELDGPGDPELPLFELRANWALRALAEGTIEEATRRFLRALERAASARLGAYSRSQRIANFVYIARRLEGGRGSAERELVLPTLHADAAYLRTHAEFRLNTPWFNNHLLNNYRAAVLYQAHFAATPGGVDLREFIDRVGRIIDRHAATLFGTGRSLLEGSVSYEMLGAKHLAEIAFCDRSGPLGPFARACALDYRARAAALYRKDGTWLIPEIGDLSPDWDRPTILLFLDAFVLERRNVYWEIWQRELAALGF